MSTAPWGWCRCANSRAGRPRTCRAASSSASHWPAPSRSRRPSCLFDEPLSNLDAKLRAEMRVELRELQRRLDITSVYVTHDQEEALAISDRVIVMNNGGIEQIGSPEAIYNRPKSRFVADFVGSANLIGGRLKSAPNGPGPVLFETEGGVLLQARAAHPPRGDEDRVAIRTAYIDLAAGPPNGAPNAARRQYPPAPVPRRFHPIHRRLAGRPADRPPPADRNVRGRRRRRDLLRRRALRVARSLTTGVGWVEQRETHRDDRRCGFRSAQPIPT